MFNEGYRRRSGERWIRDELCTEALRLGRVLAALVPGEAEVPGLLALMEFQSSRLGARTRADGTPILLEDQDRCRWDRAAIGRGVAALRRASEILQRNGTGWGRYTLQAALAECHAVAPTAADTDWLRIVSLYDALRRLAPSPVVELNRAVAIAMADPASGPAEASRSIDDAARRALTCSQRARRTLGTPGQATPTRRGESIAPRRWPTMRPNGRYCRTKRPRTQWLGAGHRGAFGDRSGAGGVEHVDDHVGVPVAAQVMQPRGLADDVVGRVTGHRIVVDGVPPVRGDDGGRRCEPRYLVVEHLPQRVGGQVVAQIRTAPRGRKASLGHGSSNDPRTSRTRSATPAADRRRCAASSAATLTSVLVMRSQRWARSSVSTPTEQPGSKACRYRRNGRTAIVMAYLRCSYHRVPNDHGSSASAYIRSK